MLSKKSKEPGGIRAWATLFALLLVGAIGCSAAHAGGPPETETPNAERKRNQPPVYPPDEFSRDASRVEDNDCPEVELVDYSGEFVPYSRTIEVNPYFKERLRMFERVVHRVAVEIYGRPPDEIITYGGYVCKTVGGKGEKWSEHTFGNAIDVSGFVFEAYEGDGEVKGKAKDAFRVSLQEHWKARGGFEKKHRQFLHRVFDTLAEEGVFKGMLGPAYPGHAKIFHLDNGLQWFHRY
jgi:hypothetical protein